MVDQIVDSYMFRTRGRIEVLPANIYVALGGPSLRWHDKGDNKVLLRRVSVFYKGEGDSFHNEVMIVLYFRDKYNIIKARSYYKTLDSADEVLKAGIDNKYAEQLYKRDRKYYNKVVNYISSMEDFEQRLKFIKKEKFKEY